ncbi:MAG: long-chain fatty acid--CoA ligase [Gammaproteobacteria bacterium]|nr:long-chain fatty acid--CoA ligase [Gammaproteobacteria bacterium]
MRLTLGTLLESSARRYPDKPALRAAGVELDYAQLHAAARRAAQVLADAGIGRGDRVALMCFNTPGFVIAAFGAWRLGATVVPLNHKLAAPEVDYVLRHCKADLVICDGTLATLVGQVATVPLWTTDSTVDGLPDFDARVVAADEFDADLAQEDDLAEVLYTSGTTGKPKGCMHDHRGLSLVAAYSSAVVPMRHDDRSLIAMPIWHASPLNNWLLGGLFIGATMVLLREYQPRAFLQTIQDERITLYFGAPVSFLAPLQLVEDFSAFDLTSIRAFIYGAGPIGAQTARMLQSAYRCDDFFQVYGMTETGPSGTILYPKEQIERAGSCGRSTLPGIDRRVVKADGSEAGPGEVGEVWFRAVTMMRGYLDDPDATAAAFEGEWYKTGDLVRLDEAGYATIVDRINDVIITGGENVHSKEVEDVLMTHPAIADVAVIGQLHAEWGETIIAFATLKPGTTLDIDTLRDWAGSRLARYKLPRVLHLRDALPRTPSGKVMKHVLRQQLGATPAATPDTQESP